MTAYLLLGCFLQLQSAKCCCATGLAKIRSSFIDGWSRTKLKWFITWAVIFHKLVVYRMNYLHLYIGLSWHLTICDISDVGLASAYRSKIMEFALYPYGQSCFPKQKNSGCKQKVCEDYWGFAVIDRIPSENWTSNWVFGCRVLGHGAQSIEEPANLDGSIWLRRVRGGQSQIASINFVIGDR